MRNIFPIANGKSAPTKHFHLVAFQECINITDVKWEISVLLTRRKVCKDPEPY